VLRLPESLQASATPRKYPIGLRRRCICVSDPKPAPKGFRWVFCRYRRVRNSTKVLDAHEYGYEAWRFLVRA
jgi:hypothetical protein